MSITLSILTLINVPVFLRPFFDEFQFEELISLPLVSVGVILTLRGQGRLLRITLHYTFYSLLKLIRIRLKAEF